jgi:hypothetical protein
MKENMNVHEILAKLEEHFKEKEYVLQTLRFCIEKIPRGWKDLGDEYHPEKSPLDHINTQILHILGMSPFEWVKSIAQRLSTSDNVVLHHLHEVSSFQSFHLRWVLDFLTDNCRLKRKQIARDMILDLELTSRDKWPRFAKGWESWCFLSHSHHRM